MTDEIKPISNLKFFNIIWDFAKGQKLNLFFGYLFQTTVAIIGIYLIFLQGNLVNYFVRVGTKDSFNNYLKEIGYILTITIVYLFLDLVGSSLIIKAKQTVEVNTRVRGVGRILEFPLEWHQRRSSGKTIQQLNSGATSVNKAYYGVVTLVLTNSFEILSVLWILLSLNVYFFVIFLVYTVLIFLNLKYWGNRINSIQRQKLQNLEHNNSLLFDINNNIMTAKANFLSAPLRILMKQEEDKSLILKHKEIDLYNYRGLSNSILDTSLDMIFYILVWFTFTSGNIDIGLISVLVRYNNSIRNSILKLISVSETLRDYKINIERMMPIFESPINNFFGHNNLKPIESLDFKNVTFQYPGSTMSNLNDITLSINKGEKTGLVGLSGSGKSTVSKIIAGLYKINSGEFLINNDNFYSYSEQDLKSRIVLVSQDTEIFNMSLKDNITLFKDLSDDDFNKIIKECELEDVIDKLPNKDQTILGEKGFKLSGGQKQRIGIARAFASNAEIIIFDESTSALDTKTEMLIQLAIENKFKNTILIFIAHRLSTLRNVNKVIVFDHGSIIETGEFETLKNQSGSKFKELWDIQLKIVNSKG
jgi:ABC-type multidrug transport system fused ATPase/permease subunit